MESASHLTAASQLVPILMGFSWIREVKCGSSHHMISSLEKLCSVEVTWVVKAKPGSLRGGIALIVNVRSTINWFSSVPKIKWFHDQNDTAF